MNCVDLFAGAGGFSLAAKEAGFSVRVAVEIAESAVETYRYNLCREGAASTIIYNDDITRLDPKQMFLRHFQHGDVCDLMLGGPPCQGFSSHRIKNAGVGDPRNSLIHTYFKFVEAFQPTYFLMENVPGMLWPRHKQYLADFMKRGQEAGYFVYDPVVLDARDYGVPQRRKRVFILGVIKEFRDETLTWPPPPTHASIKSLVEGAKLKAWETCESVFEPAKPGDINDIHMKHGPVLTEAFAKTPHNGGSRRDSGRTLDCHKDHDGHKDVYGRINPFCPAPTMTTACFNPSKGRFVHPTANHGITLRQAARIQTFPDEFIFLGGLTSAGKQIGNAVPVVLGRVLIEHVRATIQSSRALRQIALQRDESA